MVLTFEQYNCGYIVASVARNIEVCNELLSSKLNVIFINDNNIILYPGLIQLKLRPDDIQKLDFFSEFDVIEINELGRAYQCFSANSPDNAILVTDKCNSNCVMCPVSEGVRKSGKTKDISVLAEIVRHIPAFAEHLTITGGEPFLLGTKLFDLLSLLKYHVPEIEYLLLTNGRAFSIENYVSRFQEVVPHKTIIGIPLHGYDAKTHDGITQSKGSFEQTYIGLKRLLQTSCNVELRVVVSRLNVSYINHIAELIATEFSNVWRVDFLGLEMLGNAAKNVEKVWISYSEAFREIKSAIDILVSKGIDVGIYNFPLCSVEQGYRSLCHKSITDYKIRYKEECSNCMEKDACGGIFSGTIRLVNDLKPIRG